MAVSGAIGSAAVGDLVRIRGVRERLQFFTREKQWVNEQHLDLCRVPAPTFLEHERAAWMLARFRDLGCEAQIDRAGNVVASPRPSARGPFVAVTAHLDTVLAPKSPADVMVDRDGRLRGPGVSDNGAGLAGLLALARAWRAGEPLEDLQGDLLLVANVGEEGEGNLRGMRHLCQQSPLAQRIAAYLVLDGATTDTITTQALGSRRYEVTFTGPGGHSWSDYGTANPVHAISRAIARFSDARVGSSPRASINAGLVDGGSGINAIPAFARAKVDIRSESEAKLDELVAWLHESVDLAATVENERATAGRLTAKVKEIGARPAGRLADDAAILHVIRAVDAHLGIRAATDCASTDANIPLSMGVPAVSIGAGGQGGGAHTPQEWFLPDGRDLGLKRVFLAVLLLLRDPAFA